MRLKKLKTTIEENLNISIDFRSDVHTPNSFGCTPVMDYNKAEKILINAIKILNIDIVNINISMILNEMKITPLRQELKKLIFNSKC